MSMLWIVRLAPISTTPCWSNSMGMTAKPKRATAQPSASVPFNPNHRDAEGTAHFYQLRRTSESHHANANAPFYAAHECILEEGRKSRTRRRDSLHALQFLQSSSNFESDASDGSRNCGSRMDFRRSRELVVQFSERGSLVVCEIGAQYLVHHIRAVGIIRPETIKPRFEGAAISSVVNGE